ncbi:spirocyclase AveC family protein [Mycobacterium sp. E2479]|uniref:spirocyclase AveC family protein n=1 Tax=Mycobacterium sp. E2479 TaxID=1834134 RepID=UPI000AF5C712
MYNPQLWHWPEDWPLVSLSPTVEPFLVIGYVFILAAPYFPAIWTLRKIQSRRSVESFVWRHPLVSLAGLVFVFGFVMDAVLEIVMIRTGLYSYSQVIPFGSVFVGTPFQFPLLWESLCVTFVMIPIGILRLPRRHRPHRGGETGAAGKDFSRSARSGQLCHRWWPS